jgi:hypothetical protein
MIMCCTFRIGNVLRSMCCGMCKIGLFVLRKLTALCDWFIDVSATADEHLS